MWGGGKYIESCDSSVKPIIFVFSQMKNMAVAARKII